MADFFWISDEEVLSPCWDVIARSMGLTRSVVFVTWLRLLSHSAEKNLHGGIEGFDADQFDRWLEVATGTTARIIAELERREMLVGGRIPDWDTKYDESAH